MKLGKHDHVIAAFAEPASGPGWANMPVWVFVRDAQDGSIRRECMQPDEQSEEIAILYRTCAAAHAAMTAAVTRALTSKTRRKLG